MNTNPKEVLEMRNKVTHWFLLDCGNLWHRDLRLFLFFPRFGSRTCRTSKQPGPSPRFCVPALWWNVALTRSVCHLDMQTLRCHGRPCVVGCLGNLTSTRPSCWDPERRGDFVTVTLFFYHRDWQSGRWVVCVRGKLALFSKPATSDHLHILTLNLSFFFCMCVCIFPFFSSWKSRISCALPRAGCAKSF